MYLSVGLEPEEIMRLYEVQRTMHLGDSKRAVIKTIEIMHRLMTNPKLAQLKEITGNPLVSNELFLESLIDQAFQFHSNNTA